MPRISDAHSFLSLVAVKKTENKRRRYLKQPLQCLRKLSKAAAKTFHVSETEENDGHISCGGISHYSHLNYLSNEMTNKLSTA